MGGTGSFKVAVMGPYFSTSRVSEATLVDGASLILSNRGLTGFSWIGLCLAGTTGLVAMGFCSAVTGLMSSIGELSYYVVKVGGYFS